MTKKTNAPKAAKPEVKKLNGNGAAAPGAALPKLSAVLASALAPKQDDPRARLVQPSKVVPPAAPMKALPPPKPEPLGDVEYLHIDAKVLEAAVMCSAKDDVRVAITGVCIREREGVIEVIATNGHLLFVQRPKIEKKPSWTKAGVVIERELLLKLAKLQKEGTVSLGYGKNHRHVIGTTSPDFARFKLPVIDAQFPDYANILSGGSRALAGGEVAPLSAVTLNPVYVKIAAQVGAVLEAKGISTFMSHDGTPSVFTFGEASASALYLMPLSGVVAMGSATIKLLAPALRGTLAALKAHVTRARQAEKSAKSKTEEASAKKRREDLEARIAAVTTAGLAKLEDKRAA